MNNMNSHQVGDTAVISYEPDNHIKKGILKTFSQIFFEIRQNRWLITQLFKREFLATYKQSFIGVLWAVIIPLVSIGTFVILNRSGVFNLGTIRTPYPIYAVLGMAFWQIFSTGLVAASQSLVKAGPMIVKINFSKKSLVIASFGQCIIVFLVQFGMFIILAIFYKFTPQWTIVLIPLLILPLILFTLGISFIFSVLNGIMRDIGNIISLSMTFLLFLTPILYPKPALGVLSKITSLNPVYYLVIVPRDIILAGDMTFVNQFIFSSLFAVFTFFFCLFVFHLSEHRITERI